MSQKSLNRERTCNTTFTTYTVCLNKKETGTNRPISLKLDKHLKYFEYYLLEGYLLFPTVPRNVGSITSVNEHKHLNFVPNTKTLWWCSGCNLLMCFPRFPDLWYRCFFWWHSYLKTDLVWMTDHGWVHDNNGFAPDWPKLTPCNAFAYYSASRFELPAHFMMCLTKEQRVFTVTEWYRIGSLQEVKDRFVHRFPDLPVPVKSTIYKNVRKYDREGTSLNVNILVLSQIVNLSLKCSCSLTDMTEPTFLGTVGKRR